METKKTGEAEVNRRIILGALRTAIDAYEKNERAFRQVAEDIKNGKEPPAMFVRGDVGVKSASKLADQAWRQAEDAKELLAEMEAEDEKAAEA